MTKRDVNADMVAHAAGMGDTEHTLLQRLTKCLEDATTVAQFKEAACEALIIVGSRAEQNAILARMVALDEYWEFTNNVGSRFRCRMWLIEQVAAQQMSTHH